MTYLEDFSVGQAFKYRSAPSTKQQLIELAIKWDPQHLYTDEAYAEGIHGRLIASGFQILLMVFELVMRELIIGAANIGGIAFDRLRRLRPLHSEKLLNFEIQFVTSSRSKPDGGVFNYTLEARNLVGEVVMNVETPVMIQRRKEGLK
jgi:acyl dehydratase